MSSQSTNRKTPRFEAIELRTKWPSSSASPEVDLAALLTRKIKSNQTVVHISRPIIALNWYYVTAIIENHAK